MAQNRHFYGSKRLGEPGGALRGLCLDGRGLILPGAHELAAGGRRERRPDLRGPQGGLGDTALGASELER